MTAVRPGQLLLATPELVDPNFAESVVLLLDADESGALGVVLNHPSQVPVREVLANWRPHVVEPDVLFHGGPVGTDGALAVARLRDPADPPVGFQSVFSDVGLIDLDTPLELVEDSLAQVRIFAGYAGWGPGQLDAEIAEGAWYVVPAHTQDTFVGDVTHLLRNVLRRQPGELAWHSTRPADPTLN